MNFRPTIGRLVNILLLTIVISNTPAMQAADPSSAEIEQRIHRTIGGVLVQNPALYHDFHPESLESRMAFYHTPGVSIAVVNNYRLEWARGFGVTKWGATNPVTETTLFQAGSVSKPIFALAVMRLVQDGKLDLDEDVNHYLTSWEVPPHKFPGSKVTLRQILSHSAGFSVHGFAGYERDAPLPTLLQVLQGRQPANNSPIIVATKPGGEYRYAGGGTVVAQQLVIDVTGKPFPDFMRDELLAPLRMSHSTYAQPLPEILWPQAATGHPFKYTPVKGGWHVYPEMAPAGLWTTPSDVARAGIEMQQALQGAASTLLSKSTVNEMLKPGLGSAGLGFFISGSGQSARFGHNGWNEGFLSQMTFFEHHGFGAVIMVNSNEGQKLITEIECAIAREYGWPDYFPKERHELSSPAADAPPIAGQYQRDGYPVLIIQRHGGKFTSHLFGQRDEPIYRESETSFFFKAIDAQLSFTPAENLPGRTVVLHQNGADLTFKRFSEQIPEPPVALAASDCPPRKDSPLQGCWQGLLRAGTDVLHLNVRIAEPKAGVFRAELDSVDQKSNGQVLSVVFAPPNIKLVVMAGFGMFAGDLETNGATLRGNWLQNGHEFPMTFERVNPPK